MAWASTVLAFGSASVAARAADDAPLPSTVAGWQAPAGGEHPRLFFRKADLPALRERAKTPEGQAILRRLRVLLNGGDGRTMPAVKRPLGVPYGDASQPMDMPVGAYSMSHAAGYGFLYQITGDRLYADLGRQCFELAMQGYRDRDGKARYSWIQPTGALRAGPSLGWYAAGYDLCYDGWDEAFRRQVALQIQQYDQGESMSLAELARGSRLDPTSNHWGPQIGGAALALLAIRGDPGVDAGRIEALLDTNVAAIVTQLNRGWGPSGWYSQGDGAGTISSDNALLPALQAWRVAGGRDFVLPRQTAQWMTMKWVMGTVPMGQGVAFPSRGMYPHNVWARRGLSGSGTFAQGFGALAERDKPALLWLYNHFFRDADDAAEAPYDTPSPYPHRAVLAFVNWPFGLQEQNPAEVLGRVSGARTGYIFCRNQWKDATDVVVSLLAGVNSEILVTGCGMRLSFGSLPGATLTYCREASDGSLILSNAKGGTYLAVDFSRASGADLLLAIVGKGAVFKSADARGAAGRAAAGRRVEVGGYHVALLTVHPGEAPAVRVEGSALHVGSQTLNFDGKRFHLATMADGPPPYEADDGSTFSPDDSAAIHVKPGVEAAAAYRADLAARMERARASMAEAKRLQAAGDAAAARTSYAAVIQAAPESEEASEARGALDRLDRQIQSDVLDGALRDLD